MDILPTLHILCLNQQVARKVHLHLTLKSNLYFKSLFLLNTSYLYVYTHIYIVRLLLYSFRPQRLCIIYLNGSQSLRAEGVLFKFSYKSFTKRNDFHVMLNKRTVLLQRVMNIVILNIKCSMFNSKRATSPRHTNVKNQTPAAF